MSREKHERTEVDEKEKQKEPKQQQFGSRLRNFKLKTTTGTGSNTVSDKEPESKIEASCRTNTDNLGDGSASATVRVKDSKQRPSYRFHHQDNVKEIKAKTPFCIEHRDIQIQVVDVDGQETFLKVPSRRGEHHGSGTTGIHTTDRSYSDAEATRAELTTSTGKDDRDKSHWKKKPKEGKLGTESSNCLASVANCQPLPVVVQKGTEEGHSRSRTMTASTGSSEIQRKEKSTAGPQASSFGISSTHSLDDLRLSNEDLLRIIKNQALDVIQKADVHAGSEEKIVRRRLRHWQEEDAPMANQKNFKATKAPTQTNLVAELSPLSQWQENIINNTDIENGLLALKTVGTMLWKMHSDLRDHFITIDHLRAQQSVGAANHPKCWW